MVTPVYQEDPVLFDNAIRSWLANGVDEVICVIDQTDSACQEVAARHPVKVIVTDVPGKRDALRRGWEVATTPLVALVDSDTLWADDVADRVCEPFADPSVGGVGTRQNVYNPMSVWQRLNDAYLDYRYYDEIPAQSFVGKAVSCLSGRTAVYRRDLLLSISDEFMGERFWGVPCNSGEDKRLTMMTLKAGYRTVFQQNARVWSTFPPDARTFMRQRMRWARNTWRSDLRTLCSPWAWRHWFLMLTMADKAVSAFTLLIAPTFGLFALATGNWTLLAILLAWWLVSRSAKYLPHLLRRPSMLLRMPVLIGMSFVLAVLKIVALCTIRRQRWLTREVEVVDGEIVRTGGAADGEHAVEDGHAVGEGAAPAGAGRRWRIGRGRGPATGAGPVPAAFARIPLARLVIGSAVLVAAIGATAAAARGQTTPDCLLPDEELDGTSILVPARVARFDCDWPAHVRAIVLTQEGVRLQAGGQVVRAVETAGAPGRVDFSDLVERIDDPAWITEPTPDTFEVRAALVQQAGTRLVIESPSVRELRLVDLPYVYLGGEDAELLVRGTRIRSWLVDGAEGGSPDLSGGRPFVLYDRGSSVEMTGGSFADLGTDRSRATGVTIRRGSHATFSGTDFVGNHIGLSALEAGRVVVDGGTFGSNAAHGLDLRGVDRLAVRDTEVTGNGENGIVITGSAGEAAIRKNVVARNGGNGIVVADDVVGDIVEGNSVVDNGRDGIVAVDAASLTITSNTIDGQRVGVRVSGATSEFQVIEDNEITGGEVGIEAYDGANTLALSGNDVTGNRRAGIVLDAPASSSSGDVISGSATGIEARAPAAIDELEIGSVDVGVAVKATDRPPVTLDGVDIVAADVGVRVDRNAEAVLTGGGFIDAPRDIVGSHVEEGPERIVSTGGEPTPRILGILGMGFVAVAFLLEGVRKWRLRDLASLAGNAPPSVINPA
ncbi:MAG: glycosyltransferase [Actinomycetota bacterium]|nr:glycosyltransferase [Actinomycetota bacterium]